MARLIDGTVSDISPLEHELVTLAKKSCVQPADLTPSDLGPLRETVGDDALDYALVMGSFHFFTRIADLLGVPSETLPKALRRFEFLRRLTIRLGSVLIAKMDLANRDYPVSYKEAVERVRPILTRDHRRAPEDELTPLKPRPKLIEALQLALEERNRSSLDRETLAMVHQTVEEGLAANINADEGFRERCRDPLEAFAFIGTRYAYRTTAEMIAALRQLGYNDIGILDLAIAVAEANQWARVHRLFGLDPALFYMSTGVKL